MRYHIYGDSCLHITSDIPDNNFSFGRVSLSAGGNAINVARQLNKLGQNVILHSVIGNDSEGFFFKSLLEKEGIDVSNLIQLKDSKTSKATVLLQKGNAPKINVEVDDSTTLNEELTERWIDDLQTSDFVFIPIYPDSLNLLEKLQNKKVTVFSDLGFTPWGENWIEYKNMFNNVVDKVDYIITSGFSYKKESFQFLSDLLVGNKCKFIVITFSGDDVLLIKANSVQLITLDKITPINTVGAGDSFIGAFIYFFMSSNNYIESIDKAHKIAKWKISQFDDIPSLNDIGGYTYES